MKIVLASDAWAPQVNGVVRTYENVCRQLQLMGHEVHVIHPALFRTLPCPGYAEIRLAILPGAKCAELLEHYQADAVHIATEGPIGLAARAWCIRNNIAFTSSFHTRFPEYLRLRAPVPLAWSYALVRRFHRAATRTMVPTESQRQGLLKRGFENVVLWSRGVDTDIFQPWQKKIYALRGPVFLYFGRVAVEKNIEAFLDLDLPGNKVVVGGGPDLEKLRARYRKVVFSGFKFGRELAEHIAAADVFVFPSRTDTFGVVLLEAMACGVPVAAFPVTGPVDVVKPGVTGILDEDLRKAALAALALQGKDCVRYAAGFTWRASAETFLANLSHCTNRPARPLSPARR